SLIPTSLDADTRNIVRQAYAGLLWTKQYYHFVVRDWLAAIPQCRRLRQDEKPVATTRGRISTTKTSSRCLTNGSIHGMRDGTLHFTAWRSPVLILTVPKSNSWSCCASGICTPMVNFLHTNGPSET